MQDAVSAATQARDAAVTILDQSLLGPQIGAPRDIYHSPESPFVAEFVGKASTIPVRFESGSVETAVLSTTGARMLGRRTLTTAGISEGLAILRPEDARLGARRGEVNTLRVQVAEKVFLGDRIVCIGTFETGGGCEFWVPHEQDSNVALGASLEVSWSKEQTAFVET